MKMKLFYLLILLTLPFVGITQSITTYNRGGWTVTPSSEELTGDLPNGPATKMLDGDNSSFWVSNYSTNFEEYPHTLVFDMQVAQPVNQIYYVPRDNGATSAYSGSVSFGDDGINFGTEVPVIFSKTFVQNFIVLPSTQNHRYFRITINQNQSDHDAGTNSLYITTMAEVGAIYNTTIEGSLTSFTTQAQAGGVQLNWSTAQEVNSTSFNITRSADAVNFTTIGNVTATGTASTAASYSFTDAAPLTGTNFYRLEMVNTSGPAQQSIIKNTDFPIVTYSSTQSKNLNVFYFVPAGKATYPDFKTRVSGVMLGLQNYYKTEMQRIGRGAKTFSLVTDATHTQVKIIVVNGKFPFEYYDRDNSGVAHIQAEIDAYIAANPSPYYSSHNLTVTPAFGYNPVTGVVDERIPVVGDGKNCYTLDYPALRWDLLGVNSPEGEAATVNIGGTAHEAGHSLGLYHNSLRATEPELGEALMRAGNYTFGKTTTSLTPADAAILNRNQIFNDASISYYGPNKAAISSVHACYSPSKNAIIVAGRTSTSGAPVTDVSIYQDSYNDPLAPGVGTNNDYDAVTWTTPIIGTDSFYVEMPVAGLFIKDSSLYEMKILLIQQDGNTSPVYYHFDFANNIPELTDPAFTPIGATITASAGANGSISSPGATVISCAGDKTYTITPNAGYSVASVLVDGVSVGAVTSYAFTTVATNHTISATFSVVNYVITASVGGNGTISPIGAVNVASGTNKTFTITPAVGFTVANVLVDGSSVGAATTYTFTNVTTPHTISASFAAVVSNYTITATTGANGTVTPAGATSVASGTDKTYTIVANAGYTIASVLVDGVSVGAVGTYTFTNVTAAHTISASFTAVVVNYTITATTGANGTVTPAGATSVASGTNKTYTIAANTGYAIANVLVDGVSVGAVGTYTFTNVTAAHTISASFAAVVVNYTITATTGANGTVTPAGATSVASGTNKTYTIAANTGYAIANVLVDGVSVGAVGTYTFTNVTAAHTISASFTAVVVNYTITATTGANGTVTPTGATSVASGTNKTYTIAANTGYAIANVLVDGVSVGAVGTYTFTNVTAAHTISASFTAVVVNYTITASAGGNGSISPNGAVSVASGTSKTFTITPATGYKVASVLVDGTSVGAVTTYTFSNVIATHTISATFSAVVVTNYTITASAGTNGAISPSGAVSVASGTSKTFTITANSGYKVASVLVDGASVGAVTTYTFSNVTATHTISATFAVNCTTPVTPAYIIGQSFNLCGGGTFVFFVYPPQGTITYTWTVPAGFTITSGQGSYAIFVKVPSNFKTQGVISVTASNACGTGAPRSLTVYATAGDLSTSISGPSGVSAGQKKVEYSLPSAKGVTYTWTVPTGATITSGQGTCGITVKFGYASGYVKATIKNACGSSPQASKYVTVGWSGSRVDKSTEPAAVSTYFKVYPNPVQSNTTVTFSAQKKESKFEIRIADLRGRVLAVKTGYTTVGDNMQKLDLHNYANGMYILTLTVDDKIQTQKLFKNN